MEIRRFVCDDSRGLGSEINVTKSTKTKSDGKYRITHIRFAFLLFTFAFGIVATAPGFTNFTDGSVELRLGKITTLDAELEAD